MVYHNLLVELYTMHLFKSLDYALKIVLAPFKIRVIVFGHICPFMRVSFRKCQSNIGAPITHILMSSDNEYSFWQTTIFILVVNFSYKKNKRSF